MKCHDAREGFSALRDGGTSLTEWALVEAHLRQCAECRREARLQQEAAAPRVTPPRALLDSLGKAMEVTRTGVARSATLMVRLRPLPTPALKPAPRAIARVIQGAGLGVGHSTDLIARLRAVLAATLGLIGRASARVIPAIGRGIGESVDLIARLRAVLAAALGLTARAITGVIRAIGHGVGQSLDLIARLRAVLAAALGLTARAIISAVHAIGHGITRFVDWIRRLSASLAIRFRSSVAQLCSLVAIPLKTSVRAAGVVLVLAFVVYMLQWTPGPRQHVRSTAALGPTLEPAEAVSFLPPPPVAPSVEPNSVVPAAPQIDGPRRSPSRDSASASQRVSARAAVREAPALPAPVTELVASATHVVGRLAARDRTAAERDFTVLLEGVGGTELGRHHRVTFTAVAVVVPQSRYDEFARGLARLGSWQLEAARSPLPDAVHMTIRMGE
jgi:hypothetical protein